VSSLAVWLTVGFLGQAFFTARLLVQWLASERKRKSIVPVAFWWLSLLGGLALLSYAIFRRDPVIITGQAMGLFVYVRNLMLVSKARRHAAELTLTLHSRAAGPASDRLRDQYQAPA
jgi:lipid-A-disaccharide synthase-like uncharacterized protein